VTVRKEIKQFGTNANKSRNVERKIFLLGYHIFFLLWYENERGKNKSNENFKTTIPSNNYVRPKTTGECEKF